MTAKAKHFRFRANEPRFSIPAVKTHFLLLINVLVLIGAIQICCGQTAAPPASRRPDVSSKALITKTAPPISTNSKPPADPAALRKLADDYYNWRNANFPVASSGAGLHT